MVKAGKMSGNNVTVSVNPQVAAIMLREESSTVHDLEDGIGKRITVVPDNDLHIEKYEIIWDQN
jgi:Ribonuclease G/E